MHGAVAQLGERRPCKAEVTGSNPASSTISRSVRSGDSGAVSPHQGGDGTGGAVRRQGQGPGFIDN
jgi:hypothetical protein